ncbi:M23 family metallopeptidase [Niveibacterium sp. SC-1]|uniref:M23 family metallopeptidase n=1 Tax=Niveibacterium sp. SC-1 TaxID=3135646 RepID=UPI0031204D82
MAFVMISTGALTQSGVRTLSLPRLGLLMAVGASVLIALGAVAGYAFARPGEVHMPRLISAPSQPRYTVEQLGALSGRVFRLESDAAQLGRKIGVLHEYEAQLKNRKPGTGGPMLPPRLGEAMPSPVDELQAELDRIEQHLHRVNQAAAQRNATYMFFPSRLPIAGVPLGSPFGNRVDPITHRLAFHGGLDFAADPGTPVHAAAGGTVVVARFHPEFGNLIEIDHGDGLSTRYAHASRLLVKEGDVVTPGQVVSLVGSTGRSTGPHLHFEVLRDGQYMDPATYLAGL